MDLRFTPPQLRKLDLSGTEVLVATLASDERPPQGLAGLLDYRMAGRVSRLMQRGFAEGKVGEVVLVPGRPKLPFDKVLLFGIGKRADFCEPVFRAVLDRLLLTLEGLRAHRRGGAPRPALRRHRARARRGHLARGRRRSPAARPLDARRVRRGAASDHATYDFGAPQGPAALRSAAFNLGVSARTSGGSRKRRPQTKEAEDQRPRSSRSPRPSGRRDAPSGRGSRRRCRSRARSMD